MISSHDECGEQDWGNDGDFRKRSCGFDYSGPHLGDTTFVTARGHGVPIGALTSQSWGNFYLDPLDHYIKRSLKIPAYLRYLDNMVCFGSSRAQLRDVLTNIRHFIENELNLRLREDRTRIRPCTAESLWLGFRITREGLRVGPTALRRLEQRLKGATRQSPSAQERVKLEQSLTAFRGLLSLATPLPVLDTGPCRPGLPDN